jgi:hypothetical protein
MRLIAMQRIGTLAALGSTCAALGACGTSNSNDGGDAGSKTIASSTSSHSATSSASGNSGRSTTTGSVGGSSTSSTISTIADGGRADGGGTAADAGDGGCSSAATYDALVLCDRPVAYWAIDQAPATEPDLSGNGNAGTYKGGTPTLVSLPNGDRAADFNGSSQYLTVASNASLSIPTTGNLTFEGWIRPDVLQFPHDDGVSGYVDWMGKCENYSPTCEWEARMYDLNTQESPNRPDRLSAYVFNPSAGLGSAADWQPNAGVVVAGQWLHVVGEYTTKSQPADCPNATQYPGSINIWVNGVLWDQANHDPTGCMSQYSVVPKANSSALNIGTMTASATDSWFQGAIGKVAIYDHLLSQAQITAHYASMTGKQPTGSCMATCSF